ncbi:hypothetical protein GCM10025788_00010 [Serinicoccus chungangensis]
MPQERQSPAGSHAPDNENPFIINVTRSCMNPASGRALRLSRCRCSSCAYELRGCRGPFEEWYAIVEALTKDLVVLDSSGHRPLWEQLEEFVDYLVETVLQPGA